MPEGSRQPDARRGTRETLGTVLVIDDEEAMRDSCQQVLGRKGYEVIEAADAEEGLELIRARQRQGRPPAIALVDLKMPGMGGEAFLRRLREESPETVPVVITGYATLESAVQSIKDGAHEYLAKPFTPNELRVVVERSLGRHRLVQRLAVLERDKEIMRDKFAAMISHQLRSPLVGVAEYLEVLRTDLAGPLSERQREIVERMAARVTHLMDLINDWTLLSGTEGVRLDDAAREVDLEEVVRGAVARQSEGAATPHAEIDVEVASDPGPVTGDPNLLGELIGNLISNALKYTPADGQVTVRLEADGSTACVSVADTGRGIPEAELPFVFEDFFRGHGAKQQGGTGLGLPIARRIAELHGGSISVTSAEGAGSTFAVRLPREPKTGTADGRRDGGTEGRKP